MADDDVFSNSFRTPQFNHQYSSRTQPNPGEKIDDTNLEKNRFCTDYRFQRRNDHNTSDHSISNSTGNRTDLRKPNRSKSGAIFPAPVLPSLQVDPPLCAHSPEVRAANHDSLACGGGAPHRRLPLACDLDLTLVHGAWLVGHVFSHCVLFKPAV